jgi:hypothetical protein
VPAAATVSVAVPPGVTVVSTGCVVIAGAVGMPVLGANATPRNAVCAAALAIVVAVAVSGASKAAPSRYVTRALDVVVA